MCFVWNWEQTAIISLYIINWLVCITETECVYFAVRTGSLDLIQLYVSVYINNWTNLLHCYTNNIAPTSYLPMLDSNETFQSIFPVHTYTFEVHIHRRTAGIRNVNAENGTTDVLRQCAWATLPTSFSPGSRFRLRSQSKPLMSFHIMDK